MLSTHRARKGPGGCGGVGLRLKEQKGPRCAPHPWSQRVGDVTWEPSRLPGLQWVGQTPSSCLLLLRSGVWEGPSHLPILISLSSLLYPQDQWEDGPWRAGNWSGSSVGSLGLSGRGKHPLLLLDGPSHLPLLISPASLLCPQDPCGLDGALVGGNWLGSSAASPTPVCPAIALRSSPTLPRESLPPASPDLPCLS